MNSRYDFGNGDEQKIGTQNRWTDQWIMRYMEY